MHRISSIFLVATTIAGALAATAGPVRADLGQRGVIAIDGDLDLEVSRRTMTAPDGDDEPGVTSFDLGGQAHYFVADHVSIGGGLGYTWSKRDDRVQTWSFARLVAGYHVRLGDRLHLWPQAVVGYGRATSTVGQLEVSGSSVDAGVFVPVLYEPAPHFFIGVGPAFTTTLTSTLAVGDDESDGTKSTHYGLLATLGGYFGD
ncbi:MAG TPA: outer membrane beta-barrel protein [Kofleriaceae bacterium]|nr:outer membrane beta-barrel protein [Kofleriaceae bacterium]